MGFDMNNPDAGIRPAFLKEGDTIGILAPARRVSEEEIAPAIELFQTWGLRVKTSPRLYGSCQQFSGSDAQRAEDMQAIIEDPAIRAIICARGGYGVARMVDLVDWSPLLSDPKWIAGFSDITVMHAHLQKNYSLETLHATMPLSFPDNVGTDTFDSLHDALFGHLQAYRVDAHPLNRNGKASGILTGGNLSVLYSILDSPSDVSWQDKILFLEDLDEYLYHIDRMMLNLMRSGRLAGIRALVVGGMTEMRDNAVPFGYTAEEIIREKMENISVPLVFGFPAGHTARNLALYLGRNVNLSVGDQVIMEF